MSYNGIKNKFHQKPKLQLQIENAKLYKLDPYEYLRCIFDQAPYCQTEKDFEKLLPWNIKITEFHEEGTWKNNM